MSARVLVVEVIGKETLGGVLFGSLWPTYVLHVRLPDLGWQDAWQTTREQYDRVNVGEQFRVLGVPNARGSYDLHPYASEN